MRGFVYPRRGRLLAAVLLLVLVWGALPVLPEGTGLAFGPAYRVFFTLFVVAGFAFFELLGAAPVATRPLSAPRALGGVVLVYGVTVGGLVAVAQLSPQFEVPRLQPGQTALAPQERGKAIFWDRTVACFACHAIEGRGGKRAPDLAVIGTRAATRRPGVSAEDYVREHIRQGSQYSTVPGYPPIMPPFGDRLPAAQVDDLVAYLLSLK